MRCQVMQWVYDDDCDSFVCPLSPPSTPLPSPSLSQLTHLFTTESQQNVTFAPARCSLLP